MEGAGQKPAGFPYPSGRPGDLGGQVWAGALFQSLQAVPSCTAGRSSQGPSPPPSPSPLQAKLESAPAEEQTDPTQDRDEFAQTGRRQGSPRMSLRHPA